MRISYGIQISVEMIEVRGTDRSGHSMPEYACKNEWMNEFTCIAAHHLHLFRSQIPRSNLQ